MKNLIFLLLLLLLLPADISSEDTQNPVEVKQQSKKLSIFAELQEGNETDFGNISIFVSQVRVSKEEDKGNKRGDVEYPLKAVKIRVKSKEVFIIDKTIVTPNDHLMKAWITDMDKDNNLELSMWLQAGGSGATGTLLFYEIQGDKLLKRKWLGRLARKVFNINFEGLGYLSHQGSDKFLVSSNNIVWKYPLYNKGDCSACSSGGTAKLAIEYKNNRLVLGEICKLYKGTQDCFE